jgi:hypothetical protein
MKSEAFHNRLFVKGISADGEISGFRFQTLFQKAPQRQLALEGPLACSFVQTV